MRDDPGLYGGLRDGFEYREVINKGHGGVDALEIFRQKFQRLGAKPLIMLIFWRMFHYIDFQGKLEKYELEKKFLNSHM